MCNLFEYYQSSIGKKQVVALTGLLLIIYVIVHLAGNLLLFAGPAVFNGYAAKLHNLRPGLYVIEVALLLIFATHLYTTALIVLENIKSRGQRYAVYGNQGNKSWSARLMPFTGVIIFAFVIWHLLDFTFTDRDIMRTVLPDGIDYGLYGLIYNAFSDPIHSGLYILAMVAVGLHVSHGAQSFVQTFGFAGFAASEKFKVLCNLFAIAVTVGYSSIPIYVLLDSSRYIKGQ